MYHLKLLEPFGVLLESNEANNSIQNVDIDYLRKLFHKHQLVVMRGFANLQTKDAFSEYCEKWGKISVWPFGKILEIVEHENPDDHIFDNSYVPLHWDGMYRPQVPEFQIFHCVSAPSEHQGGRTTFSNTRLTLTHADKDTIQLWAKATGVYERKMEFYHSKTVAPIVCKHPTKDYEVIRYCEPTTDSDKDFINHPFIELKGVGLEETTAVKKTLKEALYDPQNFYAHTWQTGDIVIADNFTLLHGRDAFTKKAPRHLRRIHVLGDSNLNNPHLVFHS